MHTHGSLYGIICFRYLCIIYIQGKKDLVAVDNTENDDETTEVVDSENEETGKAGEDNSQSDLDSDEERRRLVPSLHIASFNFKHFVNLSVMP